MSFSYAEKSTPFVLSPDSLDEHLARGWYRMGASIFTTHFLFFNRRPFSAIWIRVDLQNFRFSKSQRKLLRRNAQFFETDARPRVIDGEREELYERYMQDFDGRLSPSISDSLEDYGESSVFSTYETTVRERVSGKLVAVSYFDLGNTSAASILGVYDPELKSFSLGYYTMLLEVQYCLDNGLRYYYPGYVVPGYDRFDYKLRIGPSQYFDIQTESWPAFSRDTIYAEGPIEIQRARLQHLIDNLAEAGVERTLLVYPLFEADLYDMWNSTYVPYPYLIYLGNSGNGDPIVLAFDPKVRQFIILACEHAVQPQLLFNANYLTSFTEGNFYTQLLSIRAALYHTASLEIITATVLRGLRQI